MVDVTIERLTITVELDGDGAAANFARLFEPHIRRWWTNECSQETERAFMEHERRLPGAAPGYEGSTP
jgi:hypothetical protein